MKTPSKPVSCKVLADLVFEFNDAEGTLVRASASFLGSSIVIALSTSAEDANPSERRVSFVIEASTLAGISKELDLVHAFFTTLEAATHPTE